MDSELNILAVTAGVLKSMKMERAQLVGQKVLDHFDSQNPGDFKKSLLKVISSKAPDVMEMQIVKLHGKTTYWKPSTYPVLDEKGDIDFLVHESHDITSQMEKEKHLSAVENELLKQTSLTDILDRQSDGFFVIDKNDCFTFANRTMVEFGNFKSAEDMQGKKVSDLFVLPDLEKFMARYHRILKTKQADHFQETYNSRVLAVDAYPAVNDTVAIFFRDITERIEIEKAVRTNEEKLKLITDQLPAFVAYYDKNGIYQFVNKVYEEWFGVKAEDIIGRPREKFTTKEMAEYAKTYSDRALRGEEVRFEVVLPKDGKMNHFAVVYVPDLDPVTKEPRGVVSIAYDITEKVNALSLRDDFLSIASHELKTPLTSLALQSFSLKRKINKGSVTPDENIRFVGHIEEGIRKINRLIDDMLDISRINHGKLTFNPEKFDLNELARQTVNRYSTMMTNISLIENGPLVGSWDKMRIEQVISNIVNNAIKYAKDSPVEIKLLREGNNAVMLIKDNGPGIHPDSQSKIFQRFERVTNDSSVNGMGLGLFICKEILERHHGSISVISKLGEGSEFRITLPLE